MMLQRFSIIARRSGVRFMATRAVGMQWRSPLLIARRPFLNQSISMPKRSLFIQTQDTPNPLSLKFLAVGKEVMGNGETREYYAGKKEQHAESKLVQELFKIEEISTIFLGADFISVTVKNEQDWSVVKPSVFSVLMDFFTDPNYSALNETTIEEEVSDAEEDSEVVAMIKELINTRIRPAIQGDGGDLKYIGFVDGVVKVQLQGSCVGCPSSSITLKHGIEAMLIRYIPEVKSIENVETELDEISNDAFRQLEEGLDKIKSRKD